MNYLAHAFLSFNNIHLLTGNMSSDFIKGKKQYDYSHAVQKGIQLHRAIDEFTDTHETVAEVKSFFRPYYRLYCGAFTDVVFDHYLALDKNYFTEASLKTFAQCTYKTLQQQYDVLPAKLKIMLPYMQKQDWLFNYRYHWGIEKSLEGVVRRAAYLSESKTAFVIFEKNYEAIQKAYDIFFPQLFLFAKNKAFEDE
jgi:acyl carrier protein phosphodiesterase